MRIMKVYVCGLGIIMLSRPAWWTDAEFLETSRDGGCCVSIIVYAPLLSMWRIPVVALRVLSEPVAGRLKRRRRSRRVCRKRHMGSKGRDV